MNINDYGDFATTQWLVLAIVLLGGFILGVLFFGSLWLATGKILHSRHPVLWTVGGFVLRMALVVPALYFLTGAQWQKLVVCLAGFIVARSLVLRLGTRWSQETSKLAASAEQKESGNAS